MHSVLGRSVPALLVLVWTSAVIWRAWAGDDAFITLRTVDNALNGYGLRWNVVERVQAYTHPLWMLLTLAVTSVVGSAYYAVMWLSIVCSAATAAIVIGRIASSRFTQVLAAVLFLSSTAILDYSTSGLENPLTHLLVTVFVVVWLEAASGPRKTFWLTVLLSGIMLNRLDAGVLVLPAFLLAASERPRRPHVLAAVRGFLPLVAWEVFSVIYYGFLFPNTAYAKLSTGISSIALARQAVYYFLDLLQTDAVTFATIVAALVLMVSRAARPLWPLALGIGLYLVYILRIGGDFMAGRFFAAPFLLAVIVLCRTPWPRGWAVRGAVVTAAVVAQAALLSMDFEISRPHGITDQRRLYSDATRLVTQRTAPVEQGSWSVRGMGFRDKGTRVVEFGIIGMTGFFAGPSVHFVDPFALADPLLARRPADPRSRIGHFERRVPAGYLDSIRSGRNRIENARIARYYDDLVLITQGPIWSRDRWRAIVKLNLFERTM